MPRARADAESALILSQKSYGVKYAKGRCPCLTRSEENAGIFYFPQPDHTVGHHARPRPESKVSSLSRVRHRTVRTKALCQQKTVKADGRITLIKADRRKWLRLKGRNQFQSHRRNPSSMKRCRSRPAPQKTSAACMMARHPIRQPSSFIPIIKPYARNPGHLTPRIWLRVARGSRPIRSGTNLEGGDRKPKCLTLSRRYFQLRKKPMVAPPVRTGAEALWSVRGSLADQLDKLQHNRPAPPSTSKEFYMPRSKAICLHR